MKSQERQKMCPQCDGRIPIDSSHCPYCGYDQTSNKIKNSFEAPIFQPQSLQDSLASLYSPPYSNRRPRFMNEENQGEYEASPPMSEDSHSEFKTVISEQQLGMESFSAERIEEPAAKTNIIWPILFLTLGAQLFSLGLVQLCFSSNGVLRLEWNAAYWFIYCLIAAPLFYLGIKKAKSL